VILLGSCNVGKTSIINKYTKGVFYEKNSSTVGVDYANRPLSKEELQLKSRTASTSEEGVQRIHPPIGEGSNMNSGLVINPTS
jgi:GTPase SAR1 family protein